VSADITIGMFRADSHPMGRPFTRWPRNVQRCAVMSSYKEICRGINSNPYPANADFRAQAKTFVK
jgi:hypothetical protein